MAYGYADRHPHSPTGHPQCYKPMQLQHACLLQPRRPRQRRSGDPWCQQKGLVRHGNTLSRGGWTTNKPPTSTISTLCFSNWNAVTRSYAKTSPEATVRLLPAVRRPSSKTSRHSHNGRQGKTATDAMSSYKRYENVRAKRNPTENKGSSATCCYCGRTGHGRRMQERSKRCPAFGKKCTKCSITNHFANVCRQSSRRPTNPAPSSSPNALEDSAATFDSLFSVSEAAPVLDAHAV